MNLIGDCVLTLEFRKTLFGVDFDRIDICRLQDDGSVGGRVDQQRGIAGQADRAAGP
ncbi:hypothetical protein [Thiohalocapsa sp. ML1]|uniref:hypothetical protein n=1 Tax=Thiohalocapsa sp. ML1 TaxID=1431688 RepID=UPI0012E39406|nr:hypothetical protein [Thiohalocapsa sp. ML1]